MKEDKELVDYLFNEFKEDVYYSNSRSEFEFIIKEIQLRGFFLNNVVKGNYCDPNEFWFPARPFKVILNK